MLLFLIKDALVELRFSQFCIPGSGLTKDYQTWLSLLIDHWACWMGLFVRIAPIGRKRSRMLGQKFKPTCASTPKMAVDKKTLLLSIKTLPRADTTCTCSRGGQLIHAHLTPNGNFVTVTGCYFIRTRIWGTQSEKVYVDDSSMETVLRESFWPDLVECRRWETTPPANKRFESSKAMEENPPERTSRGKSVPQ